MQRVLRGKKLFAEMAKLAVLDSTRRFEIAEPFRLLELRVLPVDLRLHLLDQVEIAFLDFPLGGQTLISFLQ